MEIITTILLKEETHIPKLYAFSLCSLSKNYKTIVLTDNVKVVRGFVEPDITVYPLSHFMNNEQIKLYNNCDSLVSASNYVALLGIQFINRKVLYLDLDIILTKPIGTLIEPLTDGIYFGDNEIITHHNSHLRFSVVENDGYFMFVSEPSKYKQTIQTIIEAVEEQISMSGFRCFYKVIRDLDNKEFIHSIPFFNFDILPQQIYDRKTYRDGNLAKIYNKQISECLKRAKKFSRLMYGIHVRSKDIKTNDKHIALNHIETFLDRGGSAYSLLSSIVECCTTNFVNNTEFTESELIEEIPDIPLSATVKLKQVSVPVPDISHEYAFSKLDSFSDSTNVICNEISDKGFYRNKGNIVITYNARNMQDMFNNPVCSLSDIENVDISIMKLWCAAKVGKEIAEKTNRVVYVDFHHKIHAELLYQTLEIFIGLKLFVSKCVLNKHTNILTIENVDSNGGVFSIHISNKKEQEREHLTIKL